MQGDGETDVSPGSSGPRGATQNIKLRPTGRRIADELRYGVKRLLDIALSVSLLIVLLPALGIIAVAIKLDSRGPVIFVQERAGSARIASWRQVWWEPRSFRCYKFRSMLSHSDDSAHRAHTTRFVHGHIDSAAAANGAFKLTGDTRVTRVGQFLRRMSLDELPQLVNVLQGDMSLVGPRPVPLYEVAEYETWHYERLAARPGMTGIWQVYGRGRVSFTEMMEMDIGYVRSPSLTADVKLMLLTVPAVVAGKGAQ